MTGMSKSDNIKLKVLSSGHFFKKCLVLIPVKTLARLRLLFASGYPNRMNSSVPASVTTTKTTFSIIKTVQAWRLTISQRWEARSKRLQTVLDKNSSTVRFGLVPTLMTLWHLWKRKPMKSRPYLLEMQSGGNGADVTGVVAFLGFLTYIGLMIYMFLPLLGNIPFFNSTKKASVLVTPTVIYQPVYPPGYTGVTIGGGSSSVPVISTPTAFELVVIQPTYTALPTYTPYPTQNAFPLSNHRFSFYDPLIGKDKPDIAYINCEKWNEVTLFCDSALRNGEAWQDNYFISAACPYDLYLAGAYFEVVSPDWLVTLFPHGFTCKDTGDAVTGLYIDFLIPWQSMPFAYDVIPWGTPITLRRLR